jgi:hypothetical protein
MAAPFSQSSSFGTSDSTSGAQFTPQQQGARNWLFPFAQGRAQQLAGSNPSALHQQFFGQGQTPFPTINQGGVWDQNQIQGQVNNMRAQNDASTAGQQRTLRGDLAGRGFGGNSPLYQELATNMQGQNMATNTSAENNLRFGAAQANRQAQLQGQGLAAQTAGQANQADAARRALALQQYGIDVGAGNNLLATLFGATQALPFSQAKSRQQAQSFSGGGEDPFGFKPANYNFPPAAANAENNWLW